jgi:hypothetical protein
MPRREDELAELLAQGYALDDLTWTPAGSPVSLELVYLKGQDEADELRKALDKAQDGQWTIKASAVERLIRSLPGCENYSIADQVLPAFTARAHGSRGPR